MTAVQPPEEKPVIDLRVGRHRATEVDDPAPEPGEARDGEGRPADGYLAGVEEWRSRGFATARPRR